MKSLAPLLSLVILFVMSACSSTQSLQEYYVDNADNPNFLSVDLPTSLLNIKKDEMSEEQQQTLQSLKKLNVLAFKKTDSNMQEFQTEKAKVKAILKNKRFNELMKMNTSFGRATISYLGEDDAIDEIIIYGDSDEKGFMLVRVLGDNMNPANMAQFIQALEKSEFNTDGLEEIGEFLKG